MSRDVWEKMMAHEKRTGKRQYGPSPISYRIIVEELTQIKDCRVINEQGAISDEVINVRVIATQEVPELNLFELQKLLSRYSKPLYLFDPDNPNEPPIRIENYKGD